MFNEYDDFPVVKGVILSRKPMGENNLWVTLFAEEAGIMSMSSKNFLGDSEPFVWGYFYLRKHQKGTRHFIFDSDIKDDMLYIRKSKATLTAAFNWSRYLLRYLLPGHADDELLSNLYWSMRLLCVPAVPAEAAEWRFIWLWLREWGLAPELDAFHSAKGFNSDEIVILSQMAELGYRGVVQLFSGRLSPRIRENVFKVASGLAVKFLDET